MNNPIMLFISLKWFREKDPRIPLGIAFLISQIRNVLPKKFNLNIEFRSYTLDSFTVDMIREILRINPTFLAFSVFTWNVEKIKELLTIQH